MPDKDPIVPKWKQKGEFNVVRTPGVAPLGEPSPGSQYGGLHQYSDPFSTSGFSQGNERFQQIEASADARQSRTDKFFNGVAKMGGSFTESVISSAGTIWGLAASPFMGREYIWNNEINNLGATINEYTRENFRNYRSMQEQNASAWSPDHWMTMNFLADSIIGNAGFAAGAWVTGMGMSKLLSKLTPLVARGALAEGLNIARTQGVTALERFAEAHSAVKGYDRLQAGASALFAAMGEGSVEALAAYKEFKQRKISELATRYGGEEKISKAELDQIDWDAKEVGNTVMALNIPILTASNIWQFGKSMLGYKSLASQSARTQTRLVAGNVVGQYVEQEAKNGFTAGLMRTLKTVGKAAATNAKESLEEGAQFIAGEGTKNYYARKFDKYAADIWANVGEGYLDAARDLVSTQEGVANLLAGFTTPGIMPYSYKSMYEAITNKTNKALQGHQLEKLHSVDVKETIKKQMEAAVRGASISADLEAAVQNGDEFTARNSEHDLMKNYVQSRIEAGRYDLLEQEIDRMMKMSNDEFKAYFEIEENGDIDHKAKLQKYKETAKDMQNTWVMLERLFVPALYRFRDDETDEHKKKAIEHLGVYREMAWSYLMDAKDSDRRISNLRKEVDTAFSGFVSLNNIVGEKTKDRKLNNMINEYNTLAMERELRKSLDAEYSNKSEYQEIQAVLGRLKYRINQHVLNNKEVLGLPEYIEKGAPEFMEEYLFDIEKQLNKLNGDAVFQKALLGNGSALVDVQEAITKLNDLRRLEKRRMLAVEAYNNYSSMVREGKYKDAFVRNPNYDSNDESKGQEFITNEELLHSDNYKQFTDERDEYREGRRRKTAANTAAQQEFEKELERMMNPKSRHEKRKDFKTAYNQFFYGDDTIKGYSRMTDKELRARRDELTELINRNAITGKHRTDTPEAREQFDYDSYINEKARMKAFNEALEKRKQDLIKAADKEGAGLAKQYETLFLAEGEQVAEDFYNEVLNWWEQNDKEAMPYVRDALDAKRKELGIVAEAPAEEEPETEMEAVEEIEEETPKPAALPAKPTIATTKAFPGGVEPNNFKGGTSPEDEAALEEHLQSAFEPSANYLVLRRSDLETEEVEKVYDIKTLDSVKAGTRLIIDGKEVAVNRIDGEVLHATTTDNRETTYRTIRLQELAKEGKLQKAITYRDNVYDDNGKVKTKQFIGNLYDPKSPTALIPGRKIKWQKEGTPSKDSGAPKVVLYVHNSKTNQWQKVESMYLYLDPAKVRQQFPKDSKVSEATIAAIQEQVKQMVVELRTKPYILGEIAGTEAGEPLPVGFGKLIFNQGERGQRERKPIGQAIGLEFLNNEKITGGAFIGVLENDNERGNVVRVRSSQTGNFVALNDRHDIYIPQSAVDALTRGKKGKAGQAVLALPTGRKVGNKQVYIPILLNTRDMIKDTSIKHLREDNKQMTTGELLVDVLLNPMKPEYTKMIGQLYTAVMPGQPAFDPATADWKGFYTNERLFTMMNKVFFAGAQQAAGVNEQEVRYTYPFSFYVRPDENGRLKATIDISKTAGQIGRTKKKVVIYLQNKDGAMTTRSVQERIDAYLKAVPLEEGDVTEEIEDKQDTNITYGEILDMVRSKPYRIDMDLAAQPIDKSDAFDAIILNDEGDIAVQRYDSYLHYIDDRNLLETTVQGIRDGSRQFYFANPVIPYRISINEKEGINSDPVQERKKANESAAKEDMTVTPTFNMDELDKWETNAKGDIVGGPGISATPETSKQEASPVNANRPLSSKLAILGRKSKNSGHPLLDFDSIKTVEQFGIDRFESIVPAFAEQVNQELIDMLVEEYSATEQVKTYNKKGLKKKLKARLEKRLAEYEAAYKKAAERNTPDADTYFERKEALHFSLMLFDMEDFDNLPAWGDYTAEETKDLFSYGRDENGKRIYFVGFLNLAINELFKSKIVDISANGKELLDFESREDLAYTARFDDSWSFKIDPRSTLGKFARILMSRVPQQVYNDKGKLVDDLGPLGLVRYMPYESVHKALLAHTESLEETKVFDFVENIPNDPATQNNAALLGIYKLLQNLKEREGGQTLYEQAVRQMFNPTLIQHAGYLIIDTVTSKDKNATQKIYNADRQMINDEIVSRWSKGMRDRIQQGHFVIPISEGVDGVATTRYAPKLMEIDGERYTITDMVKYKLKKAFASKGDALYTAIAEIYVNDLGFPLSGDGTVSGTAAVLQSWNKLNRKKKPMFTRWFAAYDYQTLESLVSDSLVNLIATPLEQSLSDTAGRRSTFNPEEPLSGSTTILNAYAKALKGQFQDVVNATITDINNNNRYIYVARNNLSQLMLKLKDIDYLWQVANSSYGKFMPGIADIFKRNDAGEFLGKDEINEEKYNQLLAIEMDYAGGIRKDRYRTSDSKTAKEAAWNLLGLNLFQNGEKKDSKNASRRNGIGRFLQVFGDTSTAVYYEDIKQLFGMEMIMDNGQVSIKLNEVGKHTNVKEQLYAMFKAEVNRSVEAFRKFQQFNKPDGIRQMARELRYGFHYNVVKGVPYMGSAAGIYGFDEQVFNDMMGENSPLFILDDISTSKHKTDLRIVGINEKVLSNGQLNDDYLRQVFEGIGDGFVTRMVEAKMKQLQPFLKELLSFETKKAGNGVVYDKFRMPLFSNDYVNTYMKFVGLKGGEYFTVSENGKALPLQTVYARDTDKDIPQRYNSEAELYAKSYPALLLRAMIADQQINAFLFKGKWSVLNGVDPALYQKEGKTDYRSFFDNYNKRMKGLVTPKLTTVTHVNDSIRVFTFKDPKIGDFTTSLTKSAADKLNPAQKRMFNFLQTFPINAEAIREGAAKGITVEPKYLIKKDSKENYILPARIFGQQGEVLFNLYTHLWDTDQGATRTTREKFNQVLSAYLDGKITDGNTYITLREYLYRQYLEGRIRDQNEFEELYNYYSQPNLSLSDKDFKTKLPLVGLKYVKSGVKVEGGEMLRIYGKDGEFVLFPALTAGTHWDNIREDLEAHEIKGVNPGVVLAPASSMKLGAHNMLDLFSIDGKYTGTLQGAVADDWSRTVLGKQIQNPDKLINEVTGASQANTNIHNNIASNTVFGEDTFYKVIEPSEDGDPMIIEDAGTSTLSQRLSLAKMNELDRLMAKGKKQAFERKGVYNREIMRMKFRATSELMRRDLERLMGDWGLKYERAGEEYQRLLREIGLGAGATLKELSAVMNGDNAEVAAKAIAAYRIRNRVVMDNIDKFLSDIKKQLMQRKGLTPNNTYLLRKTKELVSGMETMDVPGTFNPHASQMQSVILSRINAIIQGRKLPGFSFIQMSSLGFSKKELKGNNDLKGYRSQYDENGQFIGVAPAEIAIPWRFTHPVTGELLSYDDYVNEDGTPKAGKWDDKMLDIIGLRIPNTGPNTMGYFKVVKFLRGYKDVVQVPMEIVAQMNSDFDFDKLVAYMSHYTVSGGQIRKVEGFLDESQIGADKLLNDPDAILRAVQHHLTQEDEEYAEDVRNFNIVINAKIKEHAEELLNYRNELLAEDEQAYTLEDLLKMERRERLDLLFTRDLVEANKYQEYVEALEGLNELEQERIAAFDKEQFLKDNPDALQILQSDQQLENAIIDTYHIMLRNPEIARQMLMPLTTDWVKEQVDKVEYQGKTLRDHQGDNTFLSPNAEVAMTSVRASSTGADVLIGIFANFQKFQHIAQISDLALSSKIKPIFFGDNKGNIITEQAYSSALFATTQKVYNATAGKDVMTYGKIQVPYRLGRLFGRDENGNLVAISEVGAATLQAALDNLNDPLLGVAGVNETIANELQLLYSLGYIDHAIPFINQPVVKDYVSIKLASRDVVGSNTFGNEMDTLVQRYVDLAGLEYETVKGDTKTWLNQALEENEELYTDAAITRDHVVEYLATKHSPALTVQQLREAAVMPQNQRDADYYRNQLWVLEMLNRLAKAGQANFELQQAVNVDAKGLKDTSLIGVDDQLNKFNNAADLPIINANNVTDPRQNIYTFMAAKRNGFDPVRSIFRYGKGQSMFEELKETFTTLRNVTAFIHRRGDNVEVKKGINTAIVQFMLADPSLYQELIADFMEQVPASAAEVRDFLMKERYDELTQENGSRVLDLENNAATTLATLLDKISKESSPTEEGIPGTPYAQLYDILSTIRPVVQKSNIVPSVALYANANNYKQRLDILLPQSIVRMMKDSNPEMRKLAKMLMVYPYMVGGTNNPISFLTHIPQEVLFNYGFGQRVRAKMNNLNERFKTMLEEFDRHNRKEGSNDKRPYYAKLLSGEYNEKTAGTVKMLHGFLVQYYQHHPYDVKPYYQIENSNIEDDSDFQNITMKDKHDAPLLVELSETRSKSFMYVNKGNGVFELVDLLGYSFNVNEYDYTESNRAGKTINTKLSAAYNPAEVATTPAITKKHYNQLPYLLGGEGSQPIKNFKATMGEIMDWVIDDSNKRKETETGEVATIQEHMAVLGAYLKPMMPATVTMELGEVKVSFNGQEYNAKAFTHTNPKTGLVEKVTYDRSRINRPYEREDADFKFTMLHEATHVAGGRAITMIEAVEAKQMNAETAAKALGVPMAKFKDMQDAYKQLMKLINDQAFRTVKDGNKTIKWSFTDTLAHELHYQLMRNGQNNEIQTTSGSRQLEDQARTLANYATSNAHEFIAYVFGSHDFRKALNNIQMKEQTAKTNQSIWKKFLELIGKLLGTEQGSVLEDAFYNSMRILDPLENASPTRLVLGIADRSAKQWNWAATAANGYEVSSKGDRRFSPLYAKLKKGSGIWTGEDYVQLQKDMTIEEVYQTLIKGYPTVSAGKNKPPKRKMSDDEIYSLYRGLWVEWANQNPQLLIELAEKAKGKVLTDSFANTGNNQARALADILNDEVVHIPGIGVQPRGKALPDFDNKEIRYYDQSIFTPELVETIPFTVDLQEIADRYNYKQISC